MQWNVRCLIDRTLKKSRIQTLTHYGVRVGVKPTWRIGNKPGASKPKVRAMKVIFVLLAVLIFAPLVQAQQVVLCSNQPASIFVEQKVQTVEYQPVIVERTQVVEYAPVRYEQAIDIGCLAQAVGSFANCRAGGGKFLQCAAQGFSEYVSCAGLGVRSRAQFRRARRQARFGTSSHLMH